MLLAPPPDLSAHRRIVLFGVTGSGKSTLAVRLAPDITCYTAVLAVITTSTAV